MKAPVDIHMVTIVIEENPNTHKTRYRLEFNEGFNAIIGEETMINEIIPLFEAGCSKLMNKFVTKINEQGGVISGKIRESGSNS